MGAKQILTGLILFIAFGCSKEGPCPDKSEVKGGKPPKGTELWCEKTTAEGETILHGPFSSWHTDKQKKSEGQYLDGKKEGKWSYWYKNGKKEKEGSYKSGKMVGIWTSWHKKGHKIMAGEYEADKRIGVWNGWYSSGQKKDTGEWKNGQPFGSWIYFYKNGNKKKEGKRDETGKCTGPWVFYYEDGKKKEEGAFEKDEKVGIWKTWDKEGNETSEDMSSKKVDEAEEKKTETVPKGSPGNLKLSPARVVYE